ncbi:uncharacterized protein LOC132733282 isoform X2 [Ruditapes philippinarum]|uniref:uncharacterized protein LOC132733282 isoform X2 n=1 Tax=Ruditapes philippinarum TaxID=129788 RepID=UPI00295B804A|nr:uncharacterized protein LOC132733282 isoform X2 [Ruditapes philippinarum]
MPFRKQKKPTGLMALAGETAKMAQSMMVLNKTEAALEKELEKDEKKVKPTTKIGRIRHKGAHMIHGKYLLLMVVVLNVLDCLLVLGTLMLDIKYVTDLLTREYDRSGHFISDMIDLYPARLGYISEENIEALEKEILAAHLSWLKSTHPKYMNSNETNSGNNQTNSQTDTVLTTTIPSASTAVRKRRASDGHDHTINSNQSDDMVHVEHEEHHEYHTIEEEIAHALHKASIVILAILVVETFFKVFCQGKELLEHKLECFDGFIVIASFIVDLVFLKGLQQFTVQEFVMILAFMVPWRIIRVVNSLIVAIMDHEHLRLVLLYKQKKKISQELKELKDENKGLEACIDALQKMCTDAGLPESYITAKLNLYRKVKAKTNALGAMSNFAMGGAAMNKPFTAGVMSPQNVTITNETTSKQAKQLEDVLTDKQDKVDDEAVDIRLRNNTYDEITGRPRSRSAIMTREASKDDKNLVAILAENTASFIATINRDDAELRKRIEATTRRHQEARGKADENTDDSNTSFCSTTDSFDSKHKEDKEGLMKTEEDANGKNLQGFDNPVSRL